MIHFTVGKQAEAVAGWVAERIEGCERGFGACVAMACIKNDAIIGAVVFHNYCPETGAMEMSAAADSGDWLNRESLFGMHNYIFNTSGCQIAVMRVSENNTRMCRIARAYGYEGHRIPRLRGRNEAEIIFTLTDDKWRSSKFNRRSAHG